jgi:hypothetical protein
MGPESDKRDPSEGAPVNPEVAEEKRVIAEEHREAAEEAREAGEDLRQVAEGVRSDAEAARLSAEETRLAAEQSRRNAEHVRQASEEVRAAAALTQGARDDVIASTEAMRETLADQQRQLDELRERTDDTPSPGAKVEPEESDPVN